MSVPMRYPVLVLAIFLSLIVLYLLSDASDRYGATAFLSLVIVGITITLVSFSVIQKGGVIRFDITRPLSLYGIFYFLYYLFAFLTLFFSGLLAGGNDLTIACLLFLGYSAWYAGVKASGTKERKHAIIQGPGKRESLPLLIVCIIGISLIVYIYIWRTSEQIFFTHAMYYEQELSVAASARDVLISQFQLPIILLLGFLSSGQHKATSLISRRLFIVYGIGIFLVLVISSQTRAAITALIFVLVSMKTFQLKVIKLHYVIVTALIGLLAVLFIQGVRTNSHDLIFSDNQFRYSIRRSGYDAISGLAGLDSGQLEGIIKRVGGGVTFLSTVIDAVGSSDTFLYGRGIGGSLYGLIPRFLWHDKPAVVAPQLVVEELLSIPLHDAALGPVTQFYAEGGWIGVAVGFFLFGFLIGKLTSRTMLSKQIWMWIILFFLWSQISNLEHEVVLGSLGAVRNAFVVYLMYRLMLLVTRIRDREKTITPGIKR